MAVRIYEEPHMLHPKDGPYGFFPVQLGLVLDNRYEVVRKLGFGANASVWLAKEQVESGCRYVAIKILSTNATNCERIHDSHEMEIALSFIGLSDADKQDPGYSHCAAALRVFRTRSRWGKHDCLVFHPFGVSLDLLCGTYPGRRLPLPAVKTITRQLLLALSFLHNKLHVVHADLKLGNVLVKAHAETEEIDDFLRRHPAQTYPSPSGGQLPPDYVPTVRTEPLPLPKMGPSFEELEVCITDYGTALRADSIDADTPIYTPDAISAPEHMLGHAWSYPVDIWALGCETFTMLTGQDAFDCAPHPDSDEMRLARICEMLGPFPADFLLRCTQGREYFDAHGNHVHAVPPQGDALEQRLRNSVGAGISPEDVSATCRFIRRCLTIDPLARPSASELLQDSWSAS